MHNHGEVMHAHVARGEDGTKIITLVERAAWSDNESQFIHRPAHNTNGEQIKNAAAPAGFVDDSVETHNTNGNTVKNPIAPIAAVDAGTHNTNGNDVKNPDGFAQKDETNDSGVATVVSMVYVTMSPTFSGSIAGYTTASNTLIGTSNTDTAASPSIAASSSQIVQAANILSSTSAASSATSAVTAMVGTPLQVTRQSSTAAPSATVAAAAVNGNADDVSQSQQSTGMSDGAKAGLAIGIILALALAAGLVLFCWKRNKKDNKEDDVNEKSATNEKRSSFFGAGAAPNKRASADSDKSFGTIHTTATAPRLSLRPMTQLLPGFGGEKRKSGNMLAASGPAMSEKSSAWERRGQNENPFADGSEKAINPFEEGDGSASARQSQKNSMEGSEPSRPGSAQSAAAAAAGSPRGPNNVHRVQLDFKPSMEDELELKSGQLVRMLHEYDDGWALCVRMDRSQQGVAPRTCLSKTPVKPRGPPPGGRISPQGQMRGPPPQGPNSPRPLTPTSQQSGPVPARKPVPGQAM